MREDDEGSYGAIGLGRTLALSDGIFAIAMTLVAFQIQAPDLHGSAIHQLTRALGHLGGSYSVFALTFFVVGGLWLGHHRLFARVIRVDDALMSLNLVFLAAIALLPFPSSVLGRYGSQTAAVLLYAGNMILVGSLLALLTLLARQRGLLAPSMSARAVRVALVRSGSLVAVFAASIPVAFIAPSVAPFIWIAVFPVRLAVSRYRRSRGGLG